MGSKFEYTRCTMAGPRRRDARRDLSRRRGSPRSDQLSRHFRTDRLGASDLRAGKLLQDRLFHLLRGGQDRRVGWRRRSRFWRRFSRLFFDADQHVSRVAKFGAFVKLAPGIEGLVHISELAHHRVYQVGNVVEEGQAKMRPIQLGAAIGNRLEVVDGLNEGDRVVIRGNERLRPDQPVTVAGDPS